MCAPQNGEENWLHVVSKAQASKNDSDDFQFNTKALKSKEQDVNKKIKSAVNIFVKV